MSKQIFYFTIFTLLSLFSFTTSTNADIVSKMQNNTIKITWQRLITKQGKTCDRCGDTEKELEKACSKLNKSLNHFGIFVQLEKKQIDIESFTKVPTESNRIWIADKSLEEWLDAESGKSLCCDECEDNECRTTIINGHQYETIPEKLIIKCVLLAASQMINADN